MMKLKAPHLPLIDRKTPLNIYNPSIFFLFPRVTSEIAEEELNHNTFWPRLSSYTLETTTDSFVFAPFVAVGLY